MSSRQESVAYAGSNIGSVVATMAWEDASRSMINITVVLRNTIAPYWQSLSTIVTWRHNLTVGTSRMQTGNCRSNWPLPYRWPSYYKEKRNACPCTITEELHGYMGAL